MTDEQRLEKNKNIKKAMKATCEKRSNQICRVFKVKIQYSKLTKKQKEQLKMLFVEAKWLYNNMLSYSENNDIKTYNTKTKQVNVLDKNGNVVTKNLNFIGSQMKQSILAGIQSSIKTLSITKKNGKKIGRLKYISDYKSLNLKQYDNTYKITSKNKMKIQGIKGEIRVNGLKQFINDPDIEFANAKILNTPSGYYIAITTFINKGKIENKIKYHNDIGIDMGIKNNITLSNGEIINSNIKETERLKTLQRKLNRCKKGSNNRRKIILLIQKEYQKISNRKNDMANKVVSYLLSYENIYIQDEMISNWHKGLFGKQVQHTILGRVKAKLIIHPRVNVLDRTVPTTKYCPNCGNINKDITLADRIYICPICNYQEDRDIHSAKNMILMTKIIKKQTNQIPMEHREFKPVESMNLIAVEAGRLQPLGCN